ncbi:carboxylating nicotinate-nucleotide diphosphorylase [Coriobacteriaceae bacterium]|uniref:Nicotinate-nucleotide pyrophosphorylase [carboxylating] n=1 Tax=Granulimonas faecalis TaxID=2894155 RepID=A0AAV5B4B8_9ACTN|nr:carboxylating nicotinate-nucleotide diphosphorylase [Granulimonas faecalis]TGY58961.1 carboxylating nicotinate-nucleotide diphosphorylase [Coriobacteriaceae bacterium]GJM56067.1 nicotinate-nucleotide diphosphorylase (carboxylating) [Granulimonas faecalis]
MSPENLALAAEPVIRAALREDMPFGDASCDAVVDGPRRAQVRLIAKQDGVICGLDVFERTFQLLDASAFFAADVQEGDGVRCGQDLGAVEGDVRALLSAERVALNFLQRMSGIATHARAMAALLDGTGIRLVDTRKTTPGLRVLEKEAVRVGGAGNHRFCLSDGVMLKDNHLDAAGGIMAAVAAARERAPFVRKVEVEVETLEQVAEAVEAGADIVMLDNMDRDAMAAAVRLIDGRAEVEVSGNVDERRVAELVDLGVDYVSSGALTHSSPILDLSLKHLRYL